MSATIVPFRRDLKQELQKLITFESGVSVSELHRRHDQIRLLRAHAYDQLDAGLIEPHEIWPITGAMDQMHAVARRNRVPEATIREFNKNRWDWKSWEAHRLTWPANQRL